MKIYKLATLATLALALAVGSALARPSLYPQTSAQIAADLSNPNSMTYVPSNK
jgi:hypothetical protein